MQIFIVTWLETAIDDFVCDFLLQIDGSCSVMQNHVLYDQSHYLCVLLHIEPYKMLPSAMGLLNIIVTQSGWGCHENRSVGSVFSAVTEKICLFFSSCR